MALKRNTFQFQNVLGQTALQGFCRRIPSNGKYHDVVNTLDALVGYLMKYFVTYTQNF